MSDDIKRVDIKEFREHGYLQEVNRQFFHPLGMALEVVVEEDGSERLGGIRDSRDDPEGFIFEEGTLERHKCLRVIDEQFEKGATRQEHLGYRIQPIPVV